MLLKADSALLLILLALLMGMQENQEQQLSHLQMWSHCQHRCCWGNCQYAELAAAALTLLLLVSVQQGQQNGRHQQQNLQQQLLLPVLHCHPQQLMLPACLSWLMPRAAAGVGVGGTTVHCLPLLSPLADLGVSPPALEAAAAAAAAAADPWPCCCCWLHLAALVLQLPLLFLPGLQQLQQQ